MNRKDQITNLENAVTEATKLIGAEEVLHIFRKYEARSEIDLNLCYFSQVFDELDMRINDAHE